MRLTRTAIGLLTAQYRSVLRKCFLINVGLYALLAPAASLTTAVAVTAMPNVAAADYPVHNVPAGTTVDKIDDAFTNNTITNVTGAYVNNLGTINYIDAAVSGNTINTTVESIHHPLIYNAPTAQIKDFYGVYASNVGNSSGPSGYDDGLILLNAGHINKVDATFFNNTINTPSPASNKDPSGVFANLSAGVTDYVYGSFIGNHITTAVANNNGTGGVGIINWSSGSGGSTAIIKNVDALFLGNYVNNTGTTRAYGGAVGNWGSARIDNLKGAFIGNYVQANSGKAYGGAIFNNTGSTIGSIGSTSQKALFLNNSATSTSDSAYGGAIYNAGTISGNINADFIGNYVTAGEGRADGAAIFNSGSIGNIGSSSNRSMFIGNYSSTSSGHAYGVAITGRASDHDVTFKNIYADFIGNHSAAKQYNTGIIYLGAMSDDYNVKIDSITGNFINNYIDGTSSSRPVQGAALYMATNSSIDKLDANFINTRTLASTSGALGGAVHVTGGEARITSLSGNFISNSATSTSGNAYGGAILNSGTITSLTADFINNSATSTSSAAHGGAIYNSGTITNLTGEFKGNTTTSSITSGGANSKGGAIYNEGNITVRGNFIDNKNVNTQGYVNAGDGGAIYNDSAGTINITGSFYNNTALGGGGALYNHGTANLIADDRDIVFKNNTNTSGWRDQYNGIYATGTTNLNAKTTHLIEVNDYFGNEGILNINQGTTNIGGDYVFNYKVDRAGTVNLYNDANVRFGNVRQADGSVTYGKLDAVATTTDSTGASMNFANGQLQTQTFGALTLNGNLKVGIDADKSLDGERLSASSFNGSGKILVDYINVLANGSYTSVQITNATDSVLNSHIELSPTLHVNSDYEWDGYVAGYNPTYGYLYLTKVSTGTENLAGFLTQNATGTEYNMARDEQMLVDLGAMAGENNAKTINANGNNIIGNQHAGVTLADGQTLTINDANVEGFYKEGPADNAYGGAILGDGTVNLNNSTFRNNYIKGTEYGAVGGAVAAEVVKAVDSSFYNNSATGGHYMSRGGAIHTERDGLEVYARTKDSVFEGNYAEDFGGAIYTKASTIKGENGHRVIFSNNEAYTYGGAVVTRWGSHTLENVDFLYNTATGLGGGLYLESGSKDTITDALFKGNSVTYYAGANGGAIYVDDTSSASISNSTFENNTATSQGGAIYNAGTIGEMADVAHETYTIKQHVVTKEGTTSKLTYYDAADVTAINNIIAQNKKVQILTQEVAETKDATAYQALQDAIAADTTHATYAEKNPKLLVSIDNYYMPTSGGIQNTTFDGNYITANTAEEVLGGAIYNAETGYMNIEGSKFKNNLITQDGTGDAHGAGIYNAGVIGNLNANFEGNVINTIAYVTGGGLYNAGVIGNITSDFTGNKIIATGNNQRADGAGISNWGKIGKISGTFKDNLSKSGNSYAQGAAIENRQQIDEISGLFENNMTYSEHFESKGSAIMNDGAYIAKIAADFINNQAVGGGSKSYGAAITSYSGAGRIGEITGNFVGNNVISSADALGGAILSGNGYDTNTTTAAITSIGTNDKSATFTNNYVISSGSGVTEGGAIWNNGNITSIGAASNHAKFEGNYAQANTGDALGGAIYNAGTIDNIYADFKDNKATSASNLGHGGAIYNTGNMKITDSNFIGNEASGSNHGYGDHSGGAIYNTGAMLIVADNSDVNFKNNKASTYATGNGGAIDNSNGTMVIKGSNSHNIIFEGNIAGDDGAAIQMGAGTTEGKLTVINAIFKNNISSDKANQGAGAGITYGQEGNISTIIDSDFLGNSAGDGGHDNLLGGAAIGAGTLNLVADNKDVNFRNNITKTLSYGNVYNDIANQGELNLNAAVGKSIDFGGSINAYTPMRNIININKSGLTYTDLKDDGTFETETKDITQAGGDYIFRNQVSGQTMNLYDGANVQLRNLRQADGTTSYGKVYLTGMTVTGAGNILDTRNGILETTAGAPITQQSAAPYLGNLTLNNDLIWRLDVDLSQSGIGNDSDYLNYSSVSGSGKIVIDAINLATNSGTQTQAFVIQSTAPVKTQTGGELAAGYHTFTPDYKDKYTVKWSTDGARGLLNFTDNGTTNLNLVGYLSNASSTATTPYDMTSDEPVLRNIGAMTGTTKTVNAGDYTINGNGFAGVYMGANNQTLNINGGIWDGFVKSDNYGGVIYLSHDNSDSNINIKDATFTNNKVSHGGGVILVGGSSAQTAAVAKSHILDIDNTKFISNRAQHIGGAIDNEASYLNINNSLFDSNISGNDGGAIATGGYITVKDSTFSNNSSATQGGAMTIYGHWSDSSGSIEAKQKDVIFKNNEAGTYGGAIYNNVTLDISATGGDVKFSNNTAGTSGGAIYNTGTLTIEGTGNHKVKFEGNEALKSDGGAIMNAGSGHVTKIKNAEFIANSAEYKNMGGSAIYNYGQIDTVTNTSFRNNSSHNDGTFTQNHGTVNEILSSEFIGNQVGTSGGGIRNYAGTIGKIVETNFENNSAVRMGGAILNDVDGAVIKEISNSTFKDNKVEIEDSDNSTGNAYGGAIANDQVKIGSINADFTGNYAKSTGEYAAGAGGMVISGDTTDNVGSGRAYGGAIFNIASLDDEGAVVENTGMIDSISGNFVDNYVYSENGYAFGGAIYNEYGTIGSISGGDSFQVTLADGTTQMMKGFYGNKAEGKAQYISGGAIANVLGTITSIGSENDKIQFIKNSSVITENLASATGGALTNWTGKISNIYADFKDNSAVAESAAFGGAIYTAIHNDEPTSIGKIIGSFVNNYAQGSSHVSGGALINAHGATIDEIVADFNNNRSISTEQQAQGGAISNYDAASIIKNIKNSTFSDNYAISGAKEAHGGAIYNTGTIGTLDTETSKLLADNTGIINTLFTGNYVRGNDQSTGGAIYNTGNINLTALQSDVNFWNNKANDRYNDVYNSGTLNLNAASNSNINFGGSIEGTGAININTGATNGGTYVFKSGVSAGDVVVGSAESNYAPASLSFEKATQEDGSITNGTFDVDSLTINGDGNSLSTRNDKVDTNSATTLTLNNALNLQIDGDLQSGKGDSITGITTLSAPTRSLRLTSMNFTADPDVTTLSKTDTIDVDISGGESTLDGVYTLASTKSTDTTDEQIEQAYLDSLTSSSGNYNRTYAFRSAKLMTSGNNQTYVQYGDAITLKWLYENYINGWKNGKYIKNNVIDGKSADDDHLTVGQALTALDSALGQNDTYNFATQSVADVLVNNYYTKLMKKDEKFDTNEGIMDVKSLKKDTNSSQGRIIKGVSAFPSIMCAYPFDMPHTANDNRKSVITRLDRVISANDNHKSVIVRSAKHDVTIFGRKSDNTATTTKQAA